MVTASMGTFMMAFPTSLVNSCPPGTGRIMAETCATDRIHHLMAIVHSFPPLRRLMTRPITVKTKVSPNTPASCIRRGGSIHWNILSQ